MENRRTSLDALDLVDAVGTPRQEQSLPAREPAALGRAPRIESTTGPAT
jgi:hypothetical protein